MILLFLSCTTELRPPLLCNGLEELCNRPLNETAFLRTHNAHASEERGYHQLSMNHFFAIPTQLRDGVRALNADLYEYEGELVFCHGYCDLGLQPAEELVLELVDFLKNNPNEVLLIDLQDESNGRAAEAFLSLAPWLHPLSTETAWPTLGELIELDQRVLLFGSRQDSDPEWLLDKSSWIYSNGWHYEEPEDLNCELRNDQLENGLYEMTHVLTNPLAHPDLAESINHQPFIGEHLKQCIDEVGFVNQLSVDYYSIGDGLAVIEALNRGILFEE